MNLDRRSVGCFPDYGGSTRSDRGESYTDTINEVERESIVHQELRFIRARSGRR